MRLIKESCRVQTHILAVLMPNAQLLTFSKTINMVMNSRRWYVVLHLNALHVISNGTHLLSYMRRHPIYPRNISNDSTYAISIFMDIYTKFSVQSRALTAR